MKIPLLFSITTTALLMGGCAEKEFTFNGLICPAGKSEESVKSDFQECRYYDIKAATESSQPPITIDSQKCLESKGYKIEQ